MALKQKNHCLMIKTLCIIILFVMIYVAMWINITDINKNTSLTMMQSQITIHRKENKSYCHLISAFTTHCNQYALFWFHRTLYFQLFLSSKIPKYFFILINNMENEKCTGYNAIEQIYYNFIDFIHEYFENNINVNIYFSNNSMYPGQSRNFIANKINEYIENPQNKIIKNDILNEYHNEIVISFFDSDDITVPQKYEIIDHLYSKQHINGSILHRLIYLNCKESNYYFYFELSQYSRKKFRELAIREQSKFNKYFKNISKSENNNNNNKQLIKQFHVKQIEKLLKLYKFKEIDIKNVTIIGVTKNILFKKLNKTKIRPLDFGDFQVHYGSMNEDISLKDYGNGWNTVTLNRILSKGYNKKVSLGEDIKFNLDTVIMNFDYYLLPYQLGYYCKYSQNGLKQSIYEYKLRELAYKILRESELKTV